MNKTILILGAGGQIGTELTQSLRKIYGKQDVIATDIRTNTQLIDGGIFELLDATDFEAIKAVVLKYKITDIYLMAALLSASAEKYPEKAWEINMNSLFHVLNLAKDGFINKIFWPSSIAVFGPTTPKVNTPQHTIMEPNTVYGISKLAGERWCDYYYQKHGVDVRSLRYPGIISWKTMPGGGTTDYAVEIYHKAISDNAYSCFLKADTRLPMMFMDDAINATVSLMQSDNIKGYKAYNIGAVDFTPEEIASSIRSLLPDFQIAYNPDFRQQIADSWPSSVDDSEAKEEWAWKNTYDLDQISKIMLKNLMK